MKVSLHSLLCCSFSIMSLIIWAVISDIAATPLGVFALCIGIYGGCLKDSFKLTLLSPLLVGEVINVSTSYILVKCKVLIYYTINSTIICYHNWLSQMVSPYCIVIQLHAVALIRTLIRIC